MALDRARREQVFTTIVPTVPDADIRLVATASSVLRGIELPAADIDILFRDRAGVDAWFAVLQRDQDAEKAPGWFAEANQHFARVRVDGVTVELSTVEVDSDSDTIECFGVGPWQHFDLVSCGGVTAPTVATELRLITELARSRQDRSRPIIDLLRTTGCELELIRRGLANLGARQDAIDLVVTELSAQRRE